MFLRVSSENPIGGLNNSSRKKRLTVGGLRKPRRQRKAIAEGSLEILHNLNQLHGIPLEELLECIEPHILAVLFLSPEANSQDRKLRGKRERDKNAAVLIDAAEVVEKYWNHCPLDITAQTTHALRQFARVIRKLRAYRGNSIASAPNLLGVDLAHVIVKHFKNPTDPFPFALVGRLVKIVLDGKWSAANPERALERLIGGSVEKFREDRMRQRRQ